jgi:hypothetical protein
MKFNLACSLRLGHKPAALQKAVIVLAANLTIKDTTATPGSHATRRGIHNPRREFTLSAHTMALQSAHLG